MQEDQQKIRIKINPGEEDQFFIDFKTELLKMGVPFLEGNHNEDYHLPTMFKKKQPLEFMQKFVEAHEYNPTGYKCKKPINTSNYKDIVDPKTFNLCSKFTDLKNAEEAEEIIGLANYLRFQLLEDAVMAALAVNYFVGNDEKEIDAFIKANRLDQLTPSQISAIMEEHQELFEMIEEKQKQKALNQEAA